MPGFRFRALLLYFIVLAPDSLAAADARAAAPSQTVGERGNVDLLVFQGNKAFSSKEIRDALLWDFDYTLAAHQAASWREFLATLKRTIVAGYRNDGFLEVRVEVRPDAVPGKIVVEIKEGPRCMAGDVEVVGARAISAEALRERLTKPYAEEYARHFGKENTDSSERRSPKMSEPFWRTGNPAQFPPPPRQTAQSDADDRYQEFLHGPTKPRNYVEREVYDALTEQGFFFSRFSVEVLPDSPHKTAVLRVTIENEGPRAAIGRIDLEGNVNNSAGAIAKYLNLEPGQPFDRRRIWEMQRTLLASGRFVSAEIRPLEHGSANDAVPLQIKVKELQCAPPLDKPLSPEEQALLKFGEWINDVDHWGGDAVLEIDDPDFSVCAVVSPDRGILVTIGPPSRPSIKDACYAFTAGHEFGIYSALRRRKVVAEDVKCNFIPIINLGLIVADADEQPTGGTGQAAGKTTPAKRAQESRTTFRIGGKTRDADDPAPPFKVKFEATPESCLIQAHLPDLTCKIDHGRLVVISGMGSMSTIDAATGRLLGMEPSASGEAGGSKSAPPARERFHIEAGAFDRRCKELHELARGYANDFDPHVPLASFVGFIADEDPCWNWLLASKAFNPDAAARLRLVRRLMSRSAMAGVDEVLAALMQTSTSKFNAGCGWEDDYNRSPDVLLPNLIARTTMLACNLFFPSYSWPWTVGRETSLTFLGQGEHTKSELWKIANTTSGGPICFLSIGELLHLADRSMAGVFAGEGLRRLSIENFRKDYQLLLDDRWAAARIVERAADEFRKMPQSEVDELRKLFAGRTLGYFHAAETALRADPKKPLNQALANFFDACWAAGLREQVKEELEAICADEPPLSDSTPAKEPKKSDDEQKSPFGSSFFSEKQ